MAKGISILKFVGTVSLGLLTVSVSIVIMSSFHHLLVPFLRRKSRGSNDEKEPDAPLLSAKSHIRPHHRSFGRRSKQLSCFVEVE